jgi:hypothetical protein
MAMLRSRIAVKKKTLKTYVMEQQSGNENAKNKGGRPKKKTTLYNHKTTLYLSDEESSLLDEFLKVGWQDENYSSAARFLLLRSLKQWEKKGKKPVGLRGEF